MDWKKEAEDKLRCLEAKRSSLQRSADEIHRLALAITSIRSASTDKTRWRGVGAGGKMRCWTTSSAARSYAGHGETPNPGCVAWTVRWSS